MAQALDQLAGGKWRAVLRVAHRLVDDAQRHRVHAEFLRQLVHRAFQRQHAHGLAGCPHGSAFRQVQLHHAVCGPPVRAAIEERGGQRHRLEKIVSRQVGHHIVMRDREQFSILLGTETDPLDRRAAMCGVVENLRPGELDLHRPAQRPRGQRRQDRVTRHISFEPNPPPI